MHILTSTIAITSRGLLVFFFVIIFVIAPLDPCNYNDAGERGNRNNAIVMPNLLAPAPQSGSLMRRPQAAMHPLAATSPTVTFPNNWMPKPTPNGTPLTDSTGDLETIHVVGAAILKDAKCLVAQRAPGMSLAGKWEFPGGKPEDGETPEAALARELQEELGANTNIGRWIGRGESLVGNKRIVLDVYLGELEDADELSASEHSDLRWVDADGLADLDWPDADLPILPLVQDLMSADRGDRLG